MSQKTNRRKMIIAINQHKVKQVAVNNDLFNIIAYYSAIPCKHSQMLTGKMKPIRHQDIAYSIYDTNGNLVGFTVAKCFYVNTHIVYKRSKYNKIVPISISTIETI